MQLLGLPGMQNNCVAKSQSVLNAADPHQESLWGPWRGAVDLPCTGGYFHAPWFAGICDALHLLRHHRAMAASGLFVVIFLLNVPLDSHNCVLYLEAVTLLQFSLQLPLKEACISLFFSLAGLFLDSSFPAVCIPRVLP